MTDTRALPARLDPWILWFSAGAFFMCYIGTTTLGVVQPTIKSEFGLSHAEGVWVINSFMLTLAVFTPLAGRLGDTLGHRRVLVAGYAVLGVGSLATAFAQDFAWLFVALGIQGIGAAALYPSSVALVSNSVRPDSIGRAVGRYAGLGVFVFAVGPLLAGVLTDTLSWRYVFGANVLMVAVFIGIGLARVPDRPGKPAPFDVTGTTSLMVGLAAILVAIMQALLWGVTAPATITLFCGGLIVLAIYVVIDWRKPEPILRLPLLRNRAFRGPTLVMVATQFVASSYVIYIATYLQEVIGFGALLAAVAMLAAYGIAPWNARPAGTLADKAGPRKPAIAGMVLLVAGTVLAAVFAGADSYWLMIPSLVALGLGQPYALTPMLAASAQALDPEERGAGEGLVTAARWVSAALGTSVLGVVINGIRADRLATESEVEAATAGYQAGFVVAAVVAVAGLVVAVFALERRRDVPS